MADFLGIGTGVPIPDDEITQEDMQMTDQENATAQAELAGAPAVQQQAPAQPQAAEQGAANRPGNAAAAATLVVTPAPSAQLLQQARDAFMAAAPRLSTCWSTAPGSPIPVRLAPQATRVATRGSSRPSSAAWRQS
jgi:hypothetical protein